MALNRSTARRYAEAAFEIAERDGSLEAWLAALAVAEDRLMSPEAMRLLSNPAIPATSRTEVLERLLGEDVRGAPRNLLALMIRRGRFELLPAVSREFTRLHHRREGIVEAIISSATALEPTDVEALRERLTVMTGKRVELHQEVDASLLGGVSVRIGDRLIDGSVRGRLERLRTGLSNIAT
jgi:F-type H+-transporting ATPase subunit delta